METQTHLHYSSHDVLKVGEDGQECPEEREDLVGAASVAVGRVDVGSLPQQQSRHPHDPVHYRHRLIHVLPKEGFIEL